MADTPELNKPSSVMPYVWSTLILFLIGVILIGAILFLRPLIDPVIIITAVMGFVITISTAIAAFIKSQETHLTVNSQLTTWKKEFFELAHAKGVIEGADNEQRRIAEQKRVLALTPTATAAAPVPVSVQNVAAIPVVETPSKK